MARIHMNILQSLEQYHIRATMDVVEEPAKKAYKDFKADYYTTSIDRVLKDPEVDAVYICTHHNTHVPLGIKAAEAGKHIFCEKPLALEVEDCRQLEETVKKTGIKFMVGFTQRFSTLSQKAKELVPRPIMTWGRQIQQKWSEVSWTQNPAEGGGNVISTGCHTIDLICWFNPSKAVEIYADGGSKRHLNKDVIDTMMAIVRFENGAVATAIIADCGPAGLPMLSYELLGEAHGAFILNFQELWSNSPIENLGRKVDVNQRIPEGGWEKFLSLQNWPLCMMDYGLIQEDEAFAEYVIRGGPSPVPVEDGTRATLLTLKAFDSIRTGKPQSINL
jgi:predicted dehydrogenase